MVQDIRNEKFIKVYYEILVESKISQKIQDELKEITDYLKWNVKTNKNGPISNLGKIYHTIQIYPKNEFISPLILLEKIDTLLKFAIGIESKIKNTTNNKLKKYYSFKTTGYRAHDISIIFNEVFYIECSLKKLIRLEKTDKSLSKNAFLIDLIDIYITNNNLKNSLFGKRKDKEMASLAVDILNWNGL